MYDNIDFTQLIHNARQGDSQAAEAYFLLVTRTFGQWPELDSVPDGVKRS